MITFDGRITMKNALTVRVLNRLRDDLHVSRCTPGAAFRRGSLPPGCAFDNPSKIRLPFMLGRGGGPR
jgi:hypothetical protein